MSVGSGMTSLTLQAEECQHYLGRHILLSISMTTNKIFLLIVPPFFELDWATHAIYSPGDSEGLVVVRPPEMNVL